MKESRAFNFIRMPKRSRSDSAILTAMQRLLFCLFCTAAFLIAFPNVSPAETAVIQVQYRWASEVLPIAKHFLSSGGVATVDERTNSLIIIDSAEAIANIKKFLKTFDVPAKRVRVYLRINEGQAKQSRELSAEGRLSGDNWTISGGEANRDGVEVRAKDSRQGRQLASDYMVTTTSGQSAYIMTGSRVPYHAGWANHCRKYAECPETIDFQVIDTGLEVKPTVAGDRANIEITPRISRLDSNDSRGIVRFTAAATRLSIPLGQWITIGATGKHSDEVLRAILGRGSEAQQESLSFSIMVETF